MAILPSLLYLLASVFLCKMSIKKEQKKSVTWLASGFIVMPPRRVL
jgi:hypothetical protein